MLNLSGRWWVLMNTAPLITKFSLCCWAELKTEGCGTERGSAQISPRHSHATERPGRERWGSSSWNLQTPFLLTSLPTQIECVHRQLIPPCIYAAVSVSLSHKARGREGRGKLGGCIRRWRVNAKKKKKRETRKVTASEGERGKEGVCMEFPRHWKPANSSWPVT